MKIVKTEQETVITLSNQERERLRNEVDIATNDPEDAYPMLWELYAGLSGESHI